MTGAYDCVAIELLGPKTPTNFPQWIGDKVIETEEKEKIEKRDEDKGDDEDQDQDQEHDQEQDAKDEDQESSSGGKATRAAVRGHKEGTEPMQGIHRMT